MLPRVLPFTAHFLWQLTSQRVTHLFVQINFHLPYPCPQRANRLLQWYQIQAMILFITAINHDHIFKDNWYNADADAQNQELISFCAEQVF